MINEIKQDATQRMKKGIEALKEQMRRLRTGRAHVGLLEHITVEYYGTRVPVNQVATVAVENGLYRAPGHRLFLVRALVGLEAYVKQLGTVANWRRIFTEEVAAAREADAATDGAARKAASRRTR